MLEHVPEWLGAALHNVRAGHSKLAAVKLGGEGVVGAGGMVLTSAAFENGEELDPSFTADEEDAVAPPLSASGGRRPARSSGASRALP